MNAAELLEALEEFQGRLIEHQKLWGKSLERPIPMFPVRNVDELKEQSRWLCRKLGALRPYIERFDDRWHMQRAGVNWDVLDASTGLDAVAQAKGPSIQATIGKLDQIIGRLGAINPDDEIPEDPGQKIKPGADVDYIMRGYLGSLHPYIGTGCGKLFLDGHYAQAVEESAKAVFQYIRDKTGLDGDGAALAQAAFSVQRPVLAFSDLANENKKNEQVGFMEMLKGLAKGVRNPLAHIHGHEEEEQKAFEYLVLASLFCRRIDDATPKIE